MLVEVCEAFSLTVVATTSSGEEPEESSENTEASVPSLLPNSLFYYSGYLFLKGIKEEAFVNRRHCAAFLNHKCL
jgi:hypothetical protein